MARAPPPQARRTIAPLAVVATVAAPAAAAARRPPAAYAGVNVGAWAVALSACLAAIVLNSPLVGAVGMPHEEAWVFLGFWAEAGCVLAVLGMGFRQPALAWSGAGLFFGFSLVLAHLVWAGHFVSLVLMVAVAAWHMRLRALQPPRQAPGVWMPVAP